MLLTRGVVLGLSLFLCHAGQGLAAPEAPKATWEQDEEALTLRWEGQILWRFNYGPDAEKPFFDPLAPPGGPSLSWNAPPDHPWHHGLWFSWKLINGVNYWEEDPASGSQGKTRWDTPKIATLPSGAARIEITLGYEAPNGEVVLTEERSINIAPPDDSGVYTLEWTANFVAKVPVLLDRTPITGEPNGQTWGGYAGLSLRMPKLDDPVIMSDAGPFQFKDGLANLDARAVDYSGVIDGKRWGVAMVQHPRNPVNPTPWYVINQPEVPFHYYSPALLYRAPRELEEGEPLLLRYQILVHPGALDQQALQTMEFGPTDHASTYGGDAHGGTSTPNSTSNWSTPILSSQN